VSNVNLAIGGRTFTVACGDGEEDHVTGLGQLIAEKVAAMGDISSQSETRMLLFASLLLADELHEVTVRSVAAAAPATAAALPEGFARQLEAIAERLENLAARLEG
jgi:cell division protein ZapA